MTIIIDATVLWVLLGIAVWLFLGLLGVLMMSASTNNRKWTLWYFLFLGPFVFLLGFFFLIFLSW